MSSYFDVIRALSLRHIYLYIDSESLNNNYLRLETKQKWYGIEKRPSHYFTGPLIYNHIECFLQDCSDSIANAFGVRFLRRPVGPKPITLLSGIMHWSYCRLILSHRYEILSLTFRSRTRGPMQYHFVCVCVCVCVWGGGGGGGGGVFYFSSEISSVENVASCGKGQMRICWELNLPMNLLSRFQIYI